MLKRILNSCLILSILIGCCSAAELVPKVMLSDQEHTNHLAAIKEMSPEIYVLGNYDFTTTFPNTSGLSRTSLSIDFAENVHYVTSISSIPMRSSRTSDTQCPKAIIVSDNVANTYINSDDVFSPYLNLGFSIFFPETNYEDMTGIFGALANDSFNMIPVEDNNTDNVVAYVVQDISGSFYTANIIAPSGVEQQTIDSEIIKEIYESDILHRIGRSTADFSPGYSWNEASTGWHKNIWYGDTMSDTGWLTEWLCFYSTQTSNGDHYYAWAGEWYMEPPESLSPFPNTHWYSKYVNYYSNASNMQSGVELRDYAPKVTPTSYQASVSTSINSEKKYDFGLNLTWSINELTLSDNSSPANDRCDLKWNFLKDSSYSQNTTSNKFVMIFKDTEKSGSYTFTHGRSAYMAHTSGAYDQLNKNFYTTYPFVP